MRALSLLTLIALTLAGAGQAQLLPSLPSVPTLPGGDVLPRAGALVEDATRTTAATLERARRETIGRLVRDNPGRVALDREGEPARAGEMVLDDPDPAVVAAAERRGYAVIERDSVLDVAFVRLRVPDGRSLAAAQKELQKLGATAEADRLHFPAGAVVGAPAAAASGDGPLVGVIDGGVAGATTTRGFASGAPRANDHGTAVASLVTGAGPVRGALPGARIASADVYGGDPAGGNATAIAKALGWLVSERVGVAVVSLAGPPDALLGRVVAAAQRRGLILVAAVGNNGPAAPPAYPASYPGVVAVTGVDRRDRALIEAGRATHLDYAAPGADMLAAGVGARAFKVRGTSFAAPLVAGTIARFYPAPDPAGMRAALAKVDALARDLGGRGADRSYGRGLVCGDCRTPAP